ncbi:MAG: response regulator [Planctomycetaceae bacterium]
MPQPAPSSVRVLVIDDHPIALAGIRLGLKRYPDIRVEWEAADGKTGLELAAAHQPDVAAIDVWLPDMDGFDATKRLRAISPDTRVIIISGDVTAAMRARISHLGVEGFFQKSEPLERLAGLIRASARAGGEGGRGTVAPTRSVESLTLEEHELLSLLGSGESLKRVARRLAISSRAVDELKQTLMHKLGIDDRVELAHFALQQNGEGAAVR